MRTDNIRQPSPTFHLTVLSITGVFAGAITLASVFDIEVVAEGQCRAVPFERIQVVQPEFAGTIAAIPASNGEHVPNGAVLIELDAKDAVSERLALLAERRQLAVEDIRLHAMQNLVAAAYDEVPSDLSLRLHFPPGLYGGDIAEQRRLFIAEAAEYYASLASIRAREAGVRLAAAVTRANVAKMEASMDIERERLANAERLLREKVSSRSSYLDAEQVYTDLKNGREVLLRELNQKLGEESILEAERRSINATIAKTVSSRRAEILSRLAALKEQETILNRRIAAARLVAPVAGTVDRLRVHTIGEVVQAGEELLTVVPAGLGMELECGFTNADAGFLREGQKANIRLDAYPAGRFGFLRGTVAGIAADSAEVGNGLWNYTVRIKPETLVLHVGGQDYSIRPGMTASADVITGERLIISYFLAPLAETLGSALRER